MCVCICIYVGVYICMHYDANIRQFNRTVFCLIGAFVLLTSCKNWHALNFWIYLFPFFTSHQLCWAHTKTHKQRCTNSCCVSSFTCVTTHAEALDVCFLFLSLTHSRALSAVSTVFIGNCFNCSKLSRTRFLNDLNDLYIELCKISWFF